MWKDLVPGMLVTSLTDSCLREVSEDNLVDHDSPIVPGSLLLIVALRPEGELLDVLCFSSMTNRLGWIWGDLVGYIA